MFTKDSSERASLGLSFETGVVTAAINPFVIKDGAEYEAFRDVILQQVEKMAQENTVSAEAKQYELAGREKGKMPPFMEGAPVSKKKLWLD